MDHEFLEDLFAGFGDVTVKKMFGEIGVFHRGLSIAVVLDGVIHLKVDDDNRPDFIAEEMPIWAYARKDGKIVTMSYYKAPERLLDDPDEFKFWAEKAFAAAVRADNAKPAKQRKFAG